MPNVFINVLRSKVAILLFGMAITGCASADNYGSSNSETSETPEQQDQSAPDHPADVRIISMQNPAQPFELAAKLQWNPHHQRWDRALVLYNGNPKPAANHPIWAYLRMMEIPQRKANIAGENLYYKAFHSYEYCTGNNPLAEGKPLYITFDQNRLGAYHDEDFSSDWNCPKWKMGQHLVQVVDGKNARNGKGLQLTLPAGHAGCGTKQCLNWKPTLGAKLNQIEYSYWIKLPEHFDFVIGGKLPGVGSANANTSGKKSTGYDGWSIRAMWNRHGKIGQYVYHVDQPKPFGHFFEWDMPAIETGKWHHIRTKVQLNHPQQANGIIQTWFNGRPVLNKTDLRFRLKDGLEIERFMFSVFFGGSTPEWRPSQTQKIYFDDVIIKPYRLTSSTH